MENPILETLHATQNDVSVTQQKLIDGSINYELRHLHCEGVYAFISFAPEETAPLYFVDTGDAEMSGDNALCLFMVQFVAMDIIHHHQPQLVDARIMQFPATAELTYTPLDATA